MWQTALPVKQALYGKSDNPQAKALLERKDVIIVATVSSIYGLGDPQAYLEMVLHLKRGDKLEQRALLRRLADMQYTRNDMDLTQGCYRVRGDVIDIFPAESERDAIRVELFDEVIRQTLAPVQTAKHDVPVGCKNAEVGRSVADNRDVESTATKVIDHDGLLIGLQVCTTKFAFAPCIGQSGGGWFVDDVDHVQTSDLAGIKSTFGLWLYDSHHFAHLFDTSGTRFSNRFGNNVFVHRMVCYLCTVLRKILYSTGDKHNVPGARSPVGSPASADRIKCL